MLLYSFLMIRISNFGLGRLVASLKISGCVVTSKRAFLELLNFNHIAYKDIMKYFQLCKITQICLKSGDI